MLGMLGLRRQPEQWGAAVSQRNSQSLRKSRVLRFKDPDAAIQLSRDEFGCSMVAGRMMAHLGNGAASPANRRSWCNRGHVRRHGRVLASRLKRRVENSATLTPKEIRKLSGAWLSAEAQTLRHALDIATRGAGDAGRAHQVGSDPGGTFAASRSSGKVWWNGFVSRPGDPLTAALASQFRGNGFFRSLAQPVQQPSTVRPRRRLMYFLLGGKDRQDHNITAAPGRRRWTARHDRPADRTLLPHSSLT